MPIPVQFYVTCKFQNYLGSWPLLVMFEAFRYIKAFSWSRNIPGSSVRASPIRLERVATRPQHLFLCCRGLCVRRDGRSLIAPRGLRLAWSTHEAAAEEIEARTAKHLTFQHFEAIDMPLDRAGRMNCQLHRTVKKLMRSRPTDSSLPCSPT